MDYEPWFGEYAGGGAPVNGFENDGRTFMQFTGLLDKNGKEIYEGDILRSTETDEVYRIDEMLPAHRHDHSTNIGYYSDGKYETRDNPASRYTGDDWMSWPEMYEVIGNVYESPDLIPLPTPTPSPTGKV